MKRKRQDVNATETYPRASERAGFSLVELLVVIGIVVILVSILAPYVSKVREADRRVRCAENLRSIARAVFSYADRNGHDYPHVRQSPVEPGAYTAYTGADSPDPFAPASEVKANDVTASLWLMVRSGFVQPAQFICPSGSETADPMMTRGIPATPGQRSNFSAGRNLSYSYCSPFSAAPKYRLNSDVLPADFAVIADKSPGIAGGANVTAPAYNARPLSIRVANSTNHNGGGQNVLYADGHVQFQKTPYCGFGADGQRDNIYTALAAVPPPAATDPAPEGNGVCTRTSGPAWAKDSYLVPTASE